MQVCLKVQKGKLFFSSFIIFLIVVFIPQILYFNEKDNPESTNIIEYNPNTEIVPLWSSTAISNTKNFFS